MIVYKITNLITGKSYVGQTTRSLDLRIKEHSRLSSESRLITNSIKKHGLENFTWEILKECDNLEEMNREEVKYIQLLSTMSPDGYNLSSGGLNSIPSEETRQKMRASRKGRIYSEQTKLIMSEQKLGINNPNSKLNTYKVAEIKGKLNKGVSTTDLCKEYDVSLSTIYSIKSERTWKKCEQVK